MVVSAANSAARKRPRTSGQQPRAVEDQAAAVTGPGPRHTGEHGSEERADADSSLVAVSVNDDAAELDNADLDDDGFGDLDADDADIQAALAEGDLEEPDLSDVAAVADELVADELVADELVADAADPIEGPEPEVVAEAEAEVEGPETPGARVVKIAPDGGEDEEILVFGDDDDDLPAAQVPWRERPRTRSRTT